MVPFFYSYYRSTLIYVGEWGIHGEESAERKNNQDGSFCPTHTYVVVS